MKELIAFYRAEITKEHPHLQAIRLYDTLAAGQAPYAQSWQDSYRHLLWMLSEMDRMVDQPGTCEANCRTAEKVNRWMGFVQGVLWEEGFYHLDHLREHVRAMAGNPEVLPPVAE